MLAATLVKSPVVFPFAIFAVVYVAMTAGRAALRQPLPIIVLLLSLLACAVLAEQFRLILLNQQSDGFFAQGPEAGRELFFGAWDLRLSADFWNTLWQRTRVWQASHFGLFYIVVTFAAFCLGPDKRLVAVTVAALAAFFGGWLVLSRAYIVHDYYQLSVAALIFIAFSASLSRVLAFVSARMQGRLPARMREKLPALLLALMLPMAVGQMAVQGSLSERHRTSIWDSVEYALRGEGRFLLVREPDGPTDSPAPGGRVATKVARIDPDDFEAKCDGYLARYAAVVAYGPSDCLARHKPQADWFIQDSNVTFYLNRGLQGQALAPNQAQPLETDLLQAMQAAGCLDDQCRAREWTLERILAGVRRRLGLGAADDGRQWAIGGPGEFEWAFEQTDGGPTLRLRALEDLPWLSVFIYAKGLDDSRYHRLEVEASGPKALELHLSAWDFSRQAVPAHFAQFLRLQDSQQVRQSLTFQFGADRRRDYADVTAIDIKAGQEFRIHRLRLHSSAWKSEF